MVPPPACDFSARAIGRFQTKREQARLEIPLIMGDPERKAEAIRSKQ